MSVSNRSDCFRILFGKSIQQQCLLSQIQGNYEVKVTPPISHSVVKDAYACDQFFVSVEGLQAVVEMWGPTYSLAIAPVESFFNFVSVEPGSIILSWLDNAHQLLLKKFLELV
jgi:hypothetical protein